MRGLSKYREALEIELIQPAGVNFESFYYVRLFFNYLPRNKNNAKNKKFLNILLLGHKILFS